MSEVASQEPVRKPPPLWPREHGATMQLCFPIVSAWVLGAPRVAAFMLGAAAVAAFMAQEPVMILLGRRGARRQREQRAVAVRRLVGLGALAGALGIAGLAMAPPTARWLVLVPLALGALVLAVARAGHEKTLAGELTVEVALSSIALPVASAAGLDVARAGLLVAAWIVGFAVGTFAARGVLLQKRDRGRGLRRATRLAIVVAVTGAGVAASHLVPVGVALAPLPFAVLAVALRLRPPSPRRMTVLGFTLMGASAVSLLTLAVGLG